MKATRRFGAQESAVREQLISAARELMHSEGCAAITAGRMADIVGLKRPIVHYYFRTIEDLLLAVMRREGEAIREMLAAKITKGNPLRAAWQASRSTSGHTLELAAMAMRSERIKAEVTAIMTEYRRIVLDALERYVAERSIDPPMAPAAALGIVNSVAYTLAMENALSAGGDTAPMRAEIEELISQFDG